MSENDEFREIIDEFLVESHENLDVLDNELVSLEQDPDPDTLASIFRTIHTIKGTSGFLGFSVLERLTHVGEFLLSKLRDGELTVTEANTSALLRMVDEVRALLDIIQETGADEGGAPLDDLIGELERLQDPAAYVDAPDEPDDLGVAPSKSTDDSSTDAATVDATASTSVGVPDAAGMAEDSAVAAPTAPTGEFSAGESSAGESGTVGSGTVEPGTGGSGTVGSGALESGGRDTAVRGEPASDAPQESAEGSSFGEMLVAQGLVDREAVEAAAGRQAAGDPRHIGELLVEAGDIEPDVVAKTLAAQQSRQVPKDRGGSKADSVVRVDVGQLDNLMNLVGELVLARNQIIQFTQASPDPVLNGASQRLNLITTELQEGVMKTRMQPIDHVWSRFPRVVRDLAVACDKKVRIEMVGRDTELDRTILEAIKDPLTHLIRNSVDHGLETPEERDRLGKPEEGVVSLKAYHEGGQVNIEIIDDGKGIPHDRIRDKAIEKQLITKTQAEQMSPRDIVNLIFQPGFSTAEKVTNVSGRGVGMDVVKTNIESIGGTIDVHTELGRGTTFRIKIPLTLAIIPALIAVSADQRFAIPQVSLLELLRLDPKEKTIEYIGGVPVYRLRGDLLPIVYLSEVLGEEAGVDPATEITNIVVLQTDARPFGLVVDTVEDTAEIVVKPLATMLKPVPVFAGATIMGDGKVALILDVAGIAAQAGVFDGSRELAVAESAAVTDDDSFRRNLLLASVGDRQVAIMLSLVARLEEFPRSRVERAGGQSVVQYRDRIMPLVFVGDALGVRSGRHEDENLVCIVHAGEAGSVGLVVDDIHDIVSQVMETERVSADPTLIGSAVIDGEVVDIVDGQALIDRHMPSLVEETS